MRPDPETPPRPPRESERGIALVTTMFFTMLLGMLAAALLTSSTTETQISANQLTQTQAFYISEAGLEQAKEWLDANKTDAPLLNALLVESQNANPDQSSLTLPDTTVVATPLGTQTFANGTYDAVIRDNTDDADPLTDSDGRWIITSQGRGLANASKLIEAEVLGASVNLSGALTTSTSDFQFDLVDPTWDNQPPPPAIDGDPHDLAGNPIAPGPGCQSQPPIATDGNLADVTEELNALRQKLVQEANTECDAAGQPACPAGGTNCCTPALWWIRGSDATPRYDPNNLVSYSQLGLDASELHAIDADYVTITQPPTMILPAPPTKPFDGAPGNTADPMVSQVPAADLQNPDCGDSGRHQRVPSGGRHRHHGSELRGGYAHLWFCDRPEAGDRERRCGDERRDVHRLWDPGPQQRASSRGFHVQLDRHCLLPGLRGQVRV